MNLNRGQQPPPHNKRKRYTTKMIADALRTSGGIVAIAAQKLNIARVTLYEWVSKDLKLQTELDQIRQVNLDLCEAGILKLIHSGDRETIKFYLKCFGKDRGWIEWSRTDVTTTVSGTVKFDASEDAREIIARKLTQLAARNGEIEGTGGTLQ